MNGSQDILSRVTATAVLTPCQMSQTMQLVALTLASLQTECTVLLISLLSTLLGGHVTPFVIPWQPNILDCCQAQASEAPLRWLRLAPGISIVSGCCVMQTAEMRATMEGMRGMLKSAEDSKSLQPEPVSLLELREELRGLALSLQAQYAPLAADASCISSQCSALDDRPSSCTRVPAASAAEGCIGHDGSRQLLR